MNENSYFASSERSDNNEIIRENSLLNSEKSILDILGAISGITAILDKNRQIVYANDEMLNLLGIESIEPVLGKRAGEAINCMHATEMYAGCGTSEACTFCGAVNAIINSQNTGMKSSGETRITSVKDSQSYSWDLRVTSSPVRLRGETFYVFSLEDITQEKRKENLEKIFFHDILNSAGNLNGLLTILNDGTSKDEEKELLKLSEETSRDLIDEILVHRQLREAENGELSVRFENINPAEILETTINRISRDSSARTKSVSVSDNSGGNNVRSDRQLLQRVLINMIKNAMEATEENGVVSAGIDTVKNMVRFTVKNEKVMED